jgi:dinuclear metal center YbgI/SA1388 family protein
VVAPKRRIGATVEGRIGIGAAGYKPPALYRPRMDRSDFFDRLDEELRTDDYADVDASPNGLQVGRRAGEIETVAFAVDAAKATIEAAIAEGADALVTHHGLVWGGLDRVTGREYDRIEPLVRNDLPLYVSHLPLDGHPTIGNAAGIADLLDLAAREPFGEVGPETVGLLGERNDPIGVGALSELLADELDTGGEGVRTLAFGPEQVERVAVLTGSGVDWLDEAVKAGADALITGEGKQQVYHEAREAEINVLLAGHYATETFGVRSLQALAEEWGLETVFVDHPTGL